MSSVGQKERAANSTVHPVMAQLGRQISLRNGSLRALADETGMSKSTLARIASNGEGSQRFERIVRLAAALGYDVRLVRSK
jgi:transcriptional regulator with XRE-family HTH domain